MRVKVTQRQFELLLDNLDWISGASIVMKGKTFRKIIPHGYPLNEQQKMFKVVLWFGANNTIHIVYAHNSAEAMVLARKMFPKANVFHATPIKGKLC